MASKVTFGIGVVSRPLLLLLPAALNDPSEPSCLEGELRDSAEGGGSGDSQGDLQGDVVVAEGLGLHALRGVQLPDKSWLSHSLHIRAGKSFLRSFF